MTAAQLLRRIRHLNGRIYRLQDGHAVFVLTNDPDLAEWLLALGGTTFTSSAAIPAPDRPPGGYRRAKDTPAEWDIYIHLIPVRGPNTIYEAAGEEPAVEAVDFA
ncbi:MAG TPA: hypothetical protein VLI07_18720 [Candidatus Binatus sp.]|nr:hypothetical protein [Candidatus Binatus sp.]